MIVHDCQQYDPTWFKLRRGKPTASDFHRIVTAAKWDYAAGAQSYINDLIADLHCPWYGCVDDYVSAAMKNGSIMEPTSRRFYEFERDCDVKQVGFVTTDCGRFGCSPDGFVGEDGGLECKNPKHHTHIAWLRAGVVPPEHLAQIHGCLFVTGRDWWDFLSYAEGLPPLLIRVMPNDKTKRLAEHLERFWTEYQETKALIEAKFQPLPTREVHTSVGSYTEEIYEPSYF